jgi:hypothetical protein
MLDDQTKGEILARILQSPQFKDSKRSQELLQYLVDATLANQSPKEITIAMDFFGKDSSFDPKGDPTVRVQINHLRKKLDHYYLTTRDAHTHRLDIPKGHYAVQYEEVPEVKGLPRPYRTAVVVLSILVALLCFTIVFLVFKRSPAPVSPAQSWSTNPLWSEFFEATGKPTLIVIGDYFFLFDKSFVNKPGVIVRYPLINSPEDLRTVARTDPVFARRYVQSDFTFLRPSASWGIAELFPILHEIPHKMSMKLASQLTLDDLNTFNIVFIGAFKTLHALNRILHHFDLQYQLSPAGVTLNSPPPDSAITFLARNVRGGEYERDYAVIVKGFGPEGNTVIFILGFGDSGVLQAAKIAADPSLPERIAATYGSEAIQTPFYCNLVIEAEGINQTGFKWALKYFRRFPASGPSSGGKVPSQ